MIILIDTIPAGFSDGNQGGTSFKFSEESSAYLSRSCRHGSLLILTSGSKRTLRVEELEFSKLKNGMADIDVCQLKACNERRKRSRKIFLSHDLLEIDKL